jgi:hypothetical protein
MTDLRIISGSANRGLASAVANYLGVESDGCTLERYPDGELRPIVENICGADIYVIQPTTPPVNDHLVELLLLLRACTHTCNMLRPQPRIAPVLPGIDDAHGFAPPHSERWCRCMTYGRRRW